MAANTHGNVHARLMGGAVQETPFFHFGMDVPSIIL